LEYRPSNVFCIPIGMLIVPVQFTRWKNILNFLQVPLKKTVHRCYATPSRNIHRSDFYLATRREKKKKRKLVLQEMQKFNIKSII